MGNQIGKMQHDVLVVSRQLYPVLQKVQRLEEHTKEAFVRQNVEMLLTYGKSVAQIVQLFQYEDYIIKSAYISQVCREIDMSKEIDSQQIHQLCRAIDDMLVIMGRLIEERDYEPKQCTCCNSQVYYLPLPSYYEKQAEKYGVPNHVSETLNNREYTCPACGASDRDRLMILMMKQLGLDQGYYEESLLQIAPAPAIEHWINGNCPCLQYDSTDLYMENVTFHADIQDMKEISDETYDYIICSHVLEHVQDDRKAMRELYRILKQDGFCLFLVPIALDCTEIDEEWGLSEAENWRRFGQNDHCRRYAKAGLLERLREAGFSVHEANKDFFGEEAFYQNGMTETATLYVLTKEADKLDIIIQRKLCAREQLTPPEPLVSVLMSAYNHERYVAKSIESVLNQTYRNFEFLVADDYSTDHTVDEILKFEDQIDEIHLFGENICGRLPFLRSRARGKYIAIINSDDMWESGKLEKQVYYLERHPEVAACFTGVTCVDDNGKPLEYQLFRMQNMRKEQWMHYFFKNGNCLANPSILIHRDIYFNLCNSSGARMFRQLPDFWRWVQLVQRHEIHIIEKELIKFVVHERGDNPNTSVGTEENIRRHKNEECYIWYTVIKNMDKGYFVRAFQDELIHKDVQREEDVLAEKFFVLKNSEHSYLTPAALFFAYDICQNENVVSTLQENYNFQIKDIHAMAAYDKEYENGL